MPKRKRGNSEGSIYRMTDGRWRAAVTIGKDADGKPKRKVFTASTRHEVQGQLAAGLRDLQLGLLVAPEKQSVGQFLTWWLNEVVKPSARPKTTQFYEFVSRIHLIPGLGQISLQKLAPQQVQSFLNERLATPSERTGRPLSARSVRHIHRTLCTALSSALKYGSIARNVALSVDPPRAAKPNCQFFSVEQARAFLHAAKDDRLFALYATVLSLGLRLGEALGISWADVDLDTGRFNVHQALQRISKKLYPDKAGLQLVEPKGGYSDRVVTGLRLRSQLSGITKHFSLRTALGRARNGATTGTWSSRGKSASLSMNATSWGSFRTFSRWRACRRCAFMIYATAPLQSSSRKA